MIRTSIARVYPPGTERVGLTLGLLRYVAARSQHGSEIRELIDAFRMKRATMYRLVDRMVAEGFLYRSNEDHRYRLGIDAMQLGLVAIEGAPASAQLDQLVKRLSRLTGDTAFLVARFGDYSLCVGRSHGNAPIGIFTINIGDKRLLGIGAGGLALAAQLSNQSIKRLYVDHQSAYQSLGIEEAQLWASIEQTRALGYSETVNSITPGITGIGYAFRLTGSTELAFSIGSLNERMDTERRLFIGNKLREEVTEWLNLHRARPFSQ